MGTGDMWIAGAVVGFMIFALRFLSRSPAQPMPGAPGIPMELGPTEDELVESAIRLLEQPRRMAGGRWYRYRITTESCEAPPSQGPAPRVVGR